MLCKCPAISFIWTRLLGYDRIYNAPVDGYLALNLRLNPNKSVEGTLLEADDETFASLEKRDDVRGRFKSATVAFAILDRIKQYKINKTLLALGVIFIVGGVYLLSARSAMAPIATVRSADSTSTVEHDNSRVENATSTPIPAKPVGKLKAVNFMGTLQEVNTGCYSDGECYVVVDGKHVTVTIGRDRDVVGMILDGDTESSIGELEKHTGETVEVYAQDKGDGTFSLYGSDGFFVRRS